MRGKNPHGSRRSAILGRREEALPPAAPRPMRRIVMRALSSSASVSREKGPGEKGGDERDPKRRAFAVQRTAPFRCGATGRPLADRHPSVAARAGRPVHSRSPKSVDGPKAPQLSVSRTVLSALRPKPLYPCGEASPKYPPPAPDRRLFGTKNTEIGIRSAAAGPSPGALVGPAAATGTRRTSGFAVAMSNKLQKNRSPRARQSPLLRSRQSSDTAPPAPRSSKQYGLGRYRETVLPPSSKRIPQLIRHRGGKKTRKAEATKTNVEKPRAPLSTRSRRDGACCRGFCGRCRALWQPATCCRPRPRAPDGCAAPRSRDRGAA